MDQIQDTVRQLRLASLTCQPARHLYTKRRHGEQMEQRRLAGLHGSIAQACRRLTQLPGRHYPVFRGAWGLNRWRWCALGTSTFPFLEMVKVTEISCCGRFLHTGRRPTTFLLCFSGKGRTPSPPIPLEVGPLNAARGLVTLVMAAVIVDFPKNKCNFLHKALYSTKLPSVYIVGSLIASGNDKSVRT